LRRFCISLWLKVPIVDLRNKTCTPAQGFLGPTLIEKGGVENDTADNSA
jgi:hypothetical protein